MRIDALIAGQGLAGSLLAWELINRGGKVLIVDSGLENASQVAAGLINPVTGMRLVKASDTELLLATALSSYRQLSEQLGENFYHELPMLRLLKSPSDHELAAKRLKQLDYQPLLGSIVDHCEFIDGIQNNSSWLEQKQTGYLLTRLLLAKLKEFFVKLGCYRQNQLIYDQLQLQPSLKWQEVIPNHIIFCEGFRSLHNPWFSWVPLQPVKGEILTMSSQFELPRTMLNYGDWFIPLTSNQFRIGATFERDKTDINLTESAKRNLPAKLQQLFPEFDTTTVIAHQAGIRPCSKDRQPLVGRHPKLSNLWIFNGFGAKGSLQIPWYSQRLTNTLLNNSPLPQTANINRYYDRYFAG